MGKKISQLPSGTAISGPELFPAVQSGTTKKFTLASLMSWIVGIITPTSIGAQPKITASGILEGDGQGGITAATAGTDYATPSQLDAKANQSQLATVESGSTASRAYAVGEYFCWNGLLYRTLAAISSGGTFTPGTNCESTAVGDFLYNHEYPNEQWFTLRAGQKLTIHIGGTTAASGLSNLLMAFSSNVSTLNGGLAYLKIIDYRLNMHSLNFLFGTLPTNIAMSDAAGEMTFTNTTTANAVCNINVIMLGSLSKNISFSVT